MTNPYLLLGLVGGLLVAVLGGYWHGVRTTSDHYEAAIQKGALDAERVTREAVEAAHEQERQQRETLLAQADAVATKARATAKLAQAERDAALRKLSDVPNDDCLDRALPDAVRLLIRTDNQDGSGGSGQDRAGAGAVGTNPTVSGGSGG